MLDGVLRLRLNHVEELVVLAFNVMHHLLAVMFVHIVIVVIAAMVCRDRLMDVVMIPAPEGYARVMTMILVVALLCMDLTLSAPVHPLVVLFMVTVVSRVQITMIKHVLFIGNVGIESSVLMVAVIWILINCSLGLIDGDILVMDLSLSICVMETTVLIGPEKVIIRGQ